MAERRALVLGVGNELRGDDGAGPAVARALRARGIPAVEHGGEPAALIEAWSGADAVVLVDAVAARGRPGALHRFDASVERLPADGGGASTHGLGITEAVELARVLGRLPGRVVVLGVEGARFTTGEGLSPPVAAAVPEAVAAVEAELAAAR